MTAELAELRIVANVSRSFPLQRVGAENETRQVVPSAMLVVHIISTQLLPPDVALL